LSERFASALGRALAFCSGIGDGSLEGFVDRAAWEIQHECAAEFSSCAIIIRRGDGSSFVGRSKEQPTLPVETLLGMLVEEGGVKIPCRVRDHALDTVRFIDARFRTSIVLRLIVPKSLLADGEAAMWVGLQGSATPRRIELAQNVAATISQWLGIYGPVLVAVKMFGERIAGLRARVSEMIALAHDVKAPLGALKYLISDVAQEYPQIYEDSQRLHDELSYIEQLLSECAPGGAVTERTRSGLSDIPRVVRRVCDRFRPEALERGNYISVAIPAGLYAQAQISELDLERVVSNVVGNAVRYSGAGQVGIHLQFLSASDGAPSRWVIRVVDQGPGIPQSVIDQVALGGSHSCSADSKGWGVGLVACRAALLARGGELVLSASQHGSSVEIIVPEGQVLTRQLWHSVAERTAESYSSRLSERGDTPLLVVDDDTEHTDSLGRLLVRKGISAEGVSAVEQALAVIVQRPQVAVLCDAHMPDGGAEHLLQRLVQSGCAVRFAVMSGEINDDLLYRFAALGAQEFFSKPLDVDCLVSWLSAERQSLTQA
jgi:signal transduction histidine kinase/ActR/RegA family two-component response regulator